MRTLTTTNSKTRLVSAFAVLLISLVTTLNSNAATISIKSSINWSAITGGSGVGGAPNASDDVEISGNGTYVTINTNAVCKTLKIGKNAPHLMGLIFTGSNNLTVSGAITGDFGSSNGTRGGSFDFGTNNATGTLTTLGFVGTVATDTFYLTPGSGTINVTGTNTLPRTMKNFHNLILGGATTLATDINVTGNLTTNNTLTTNSFGVTMNGTIAQAINGASAATFNNLTIANTSNIVNTATNISIVSGKSLTINANATFKPGATNTVSGAGTITGAGTAVVTRSGSSAYATQYAITNQSLGNLTLDFTGSASQTVTSALSGLKNIIVSNTAGTTFDNNIALSGNLTVNPNAIVTVTSSKIMSGNTLVGSGKVIVTKTGSATDDFTSQYAFTPATSTLTIEFAGSSATQKTAYSPFSNLIISNATTLGANTVITGNLTLNSTFTTTGYTVTMNGVSAQNITGAAAPSFNNLVVSTATTLGTNINVSGDLTLNNTFTTTGYTVTMNGASNQTISGSVSPSLNSLTVNKSAGSLNLGNNTTVNSLTLTSGKIALGNYNLTMTGAISGGSASSYVQADGTGRLKATVQNNNTAKSFPVGSSTAFLPVSVKVPATASSTLFSVGANDNILNSSNSSIIAHAVKATWSVIPASTVNGMVLTFNWNSGQNHSDYDATKSFIVSRANTSTNWEAIDPSTIPNGTNVSGSTNPYSQSTPSIPSTNTNIGLYSIGDVAAQFGTVVPLPVDLISFTANKMNDAQARLDWSTAWEVNNRGFEVERSTNGGYWTNIGFVAGNGNSNQILNYSFATSLAGINTSLVYYRLKQVDFNGKFEYSPVRTVRLSGAVAKVEGIYPNPATNRISISLAAVEAGQLAKITILDMTGKVIMTSEQMVEEGNTALDMNIENLEKGNYIVNVSSATTSYNTKLIKL